jgi:2-oxoisovalerate dehydrogenase E1 component
MGSVAAERRTKSAGSGLSGLTGAEWVDVYRLMYMSRRLDDREILLKNQQKIFFQISGAGHEALLVAAGKALKPGYDWFYPYYRDRALCLTLGVTAEEMLLQAVGAATDPASGGRQMPSHWGNQRLNIVTQSSSVATQMLQAVGCAEAGRYLARHPDAAERQGDDDYRAFHNVSFHGDEVVYASIGEGSTSQGEFWESLSTASLEKLPMVFVVEDNGYAISTPVEVNTPGGNISRLVENFPNFFFAEVDGTDPVESYAAMTTAVAHCRARKGPAFVHGHVTRPYSHSLSDNAKLYRSAAELEAENLRDPMPKLQLRLLREGVIDAEGITRLEKTVDDEIQAATDRVLRAPFPSAETIYQYVYSPDIDPTSKKFASEIPNLTGPDRTMADLINACLKDEMKRDPRIIVFGEDVADCSREEQLQSGAVKGKGGVFKLTAGLQCEYGSDRVFNSPLAEANIVGRAVGVATRGMKPVAEIQFFDYIWPAMHQLRNELAPLRWRSNNAFSSPAVIRVAIGGYLTGGALYHSQSGEVLFTHTPGMRVVFPSNALDANGLLRTAIRCDDPVMFLEHKRLYRETYGRAPYPGPDYMVPFGKAKTVREGKHLTLVTYGALVPRALQAAHRASRELGIETEVIDLRTLSPYDWEAIAESVRRTSRVIVAHEDVLSWGYGAEIAARIADELFDDLDAPVKRVAATDTFVAYQPQLENVILPQPEDVFRAIEGLAKF